MTTRGHGIVPHGNYELQTANCKSAIKEEKPVVALIQTLLRYGASTTQVTRYHDRMTRFLMITFNVLSIQLTRFLMIK